VLKNVTVRLLKSLGCVIIHLISFILACLMQVLFLATASFGAVSAY